MKKSMKKCLPECLTCLCLGFFKSFHKSSTLNNISQANMNSRLLSELNDGVFVKVYNPIKTFSLVVMVRFDQERPLMTQ